MGEVPAMLCFEHPMKGFGEVIEYLGRCTQAKWKKHIHIVFTLPFENHKPIIARTNWNMAKSRFEISFHHDGTFSGGSDKTNGVIE
jgi:hypothetical protein